ncbi:MAG: hypothetical protein HY000_08925 [Planctomycetes bacterium]|nr:hypothetical protein [Planctomycetota bacterium]
MAVNVYQDWLGISKELCPPDYYRLLGITDTESNRAVIDQAVRDRMARVRAYQVGAYAEECQILLSELAQAYVTLITPERRAAYDAQLRLPTAPPPKRPGTQPLPSAEKQAAAIRPAQQAPQPTTESYAVAPELVGEVDAAQRQTQERQRNIKRAMAILAAAVNDPRKSVRSTLEECIRLGVDRDEAEAVIQALRAPKPEWRRASSSPLRHISSLCHSVNDLLSGWVGDRFGLMAFGILAMLVVIAGIVWVCRQWESELQKDWVKIQSPREAKNSSRSQGGPSQRSSSNSQSPAVPVAPSQQSPKRADDDAPAKEDTGTPPLSAGVSIEDSSIKAWIVPNSVAYIMTTAPAIVVARYARTLDAQQQDLIRHSDGRMLEDGTYHLFEIPADGEVTMEWRGRATGNRQVFLSVWNGRQWVHNDYPGYSGQAVRLKLQPVQGDKAVFVMINCTSGSIATDCVGVVESN